MSNMNSKNSPLMEDQKAQQYFNSLPAYVQENIKQSGVEITSEEHLRQIAQNFQTK